MDFGQDAVVTNQSGNIYSVHYFNTGYKSISLTATEKNQTKTITKREFIHINSYPNKIISNFTHWNIPVVSNCDDGADYSPFVIFTELAILGDNDYSNDTYLWDSGDGTYSTESDTAHEDFSGGEYTVYLKLCDDDSGCDQSQQTIYINSKCFELEGEQPIILLNGKKEGELYALYCKRYN